MPHLHITWWTGKHNHDIKKTTHRAFFKQCVTSWRTMQETYPEGQSVLISQHPARWHLQSQSAIKLHKRTLSKWVCYPSSQVYNIIITHKSCVKPFLSPYTYKKRHNKMSQIKTFTHNLNHFSNRTSHLDVQLSIHATKLSAKKKCHSH